MAELSDIYNELGQDIYPEVMEIAFPDTMTVIRDSLTKTSKGRHWKGEINPYTSVPVMYEPMPLNFGEWRQQGEIDVSIQKYVLTFPRHKPDGTEIDPQPNTDRLMVAARGNEAAKTFKIISLADSQGCWWEAVCEKEN